jgi:hypothetical protein
VGKIFPGAHDAVKASVAVWRNGGDGTLLMVGMGAADRRCEAYVNTDSGKLSVFFDDPDTSSSYKVTTLDAPPAQTWTRLGVEADWAARRLRLSVGSVAGSDVPIPCALVSGDVLVALGSNCEESSPEPREVRYDDLSVSPR